MKPSEARTLGALTRGSTARKVCVPFGPYEIDLLKISVTALLLIQYVLAFLAYIEVVRLNHAIRIDRFSVYVIVYPARHNNFPALLAEPSRQSLFQADCLVLDFFILQNIRWLWKAQNRTPLEPTLDDVLDSFSLLKSIQSLVRRAGGFDRNGSNLPFT